VGILIQTVTEGDYEFSAMGMTMPEADMLYLMFHSSQVGANNHTFVSDAELDELLTRVRAETDPDARQEAVDEAQRMIVEKAYMLPLYIPINYYAMNTRVKDYVYSESLNLVYLQNAYIEE